MRKYKKLSNFRAKKIHWMKEKEFFWSGLFSVFKVRPKSALGSCILYYKHTCLCNQVYFFEKLETEYDFGNLNCFCYKFNLFEQIMKWFDSLFWLLNTKSNFQKLKDRQIDRLISVSISFYLLKHFIVGFVPIYIKDFMHVSPLVHYFLNDFPWETKNVF